MASDILQPLHTNIQRVRLFACQLYEELIHLKNLIFTVNMIALIIIIIFGEPRKCNQIKKRQGRL